MTIRLVDPIVRSQAFVYSLDADAKKYIGAVENADGRKLENQIRFAIDQFVLACKADGTWAAIKASCILVGARTLAGALVPLVGSAPSNVGPFVSGDYNRKIGLIGDGLTKWLDTNRNNIADPQNSIHQAVWISSAHASGSIGAFIGVGSGLDSGATHIIADRTVNDWIAFRNRQSSPQLIAGSSAVGFIGQSRAGSETYTLRMIGANSTLTSTSQSAFSGNSFVFARNATGSNLPTNARLAFYSIGESVNLALLESRLSALITAIGAAIP